VHRLRVLVVDDNPDIVATTMALLRLDGHETEGCYSGTDVLTCVTGFQPDVVVLDIGLPGLSGWEVARRIRARIQGKQPMIIGVTGEYTKEVDKILSEVIGFDYYLVKPADPKVLGALVAKARTGGHSGSV
jgi:DNA-binding response OmpR family regulator